MTESNVTFEHQAGFEAGEVSGNVRLGKLEAMYEELFAEVIEDGVITVEERKQLDKMADSLGLDRMRLRKLETALQAAYESRNRIVIRDMSDLDPGPASIQPLAPATDARTQALERRIKALEAKVKDLETELEEARAHISVEIDLSDVAPPAKERAALPEEDPADLARRVRHDPRDEDSLHALFRLYEKRQDRDAQYLVAQVLAYLGAANDAQKALYEQHKPVGLIRPKAALGREAWTRLLFHPEEEPLVGEIFGVVVSAVLVGRISALRRDKQLVKLEADKKQDPESSTIQAVRCFHWAAAILGMRSPSLYLAPDFAGAVEMVPNIPPASRLGKGALSGRSAGELAFLAGRHLGHYREEHFVKLLVPDARGLEEIFLAALSIGNPGLPLASHVKELVVPIAKAIEPILEAPQLDQLRGQFLRFVEEGGRVNLARWATSVDRTCARTGLLLAGDLKAAENVLALETKDGAALEDKMNDLMSFLLSERAVKLRKQLGIAVG